VAEKMEKEESFVEGSTLRLFAAEEPSHVANAAQ